MNPYWNPMQDFIFKARQFGQFGDWEAMRNCADMAEYYCGKWKAWENMNLACIEAIQTVDIPRVVDTAVDQWMWNEKDRRERGREVG